MLATLVRFFFQIRDQRRFLPKQRDEEVQKAVNNVAFVAFAQSFNVQRLVLETQR